MMLRAGRFPDHKVSVLSQLPRNAQAMTSTPHLCWQSWVLRGTDRVRQTCLPSHGPDLEASEPRGEGGTPSRRRHWTGQAREWSQAAFNVGDGLAELKRRKATYFLPCVGLSVLWHQKGPFSELGRARFQQNVSVGV